jgi:wyosine [tRNA(Phe)-imidazoG37] synthetase (radical SAM superfamily)
MKYVYGPVKSRRLGNSLGISTVPYKVCSFDCVYCQLKKTTEKTGRRKEYIPQEEILEEIAQFFKNRPKGLKIDYLTFSGSGEPTLNRSIGSLIKAAKKMTPIPVALITNSSAMADAKVRRVLLGVDVIVPSLDAVTQDVFEKINRPIKGLRIKDIISGLLKFRKEFRGRMWLEVMLVRGLNDSMAYLRKIKKVVDLIKPEKVQLNMPVRTPAEAWVRLPMRSTLIQAKKIFGKNCDIVC